MIKKTLFFAASLMTVLWLAASGGLPESDHLQVQIQSPTPSPAAGQPGAVPSFFAENKGQLDARARYYVKLVNGTAYYASDAMVYQIIGQNPQSGSLSGAGADGRIWNVFARFEGANPRVRIEGSAEQPGKVNYFRGSDPSKWVTGARTYGRLTYRDLYPGIDLFVSIDHGRLKNEYLVRPGGRVEDIRLKYEGMDSLTVADRGGLVLKARDGELTEGAPLSFQEVEGRRVEVKVEYLVEAGGLVRFKAGDYDRKSDLVIDPELYFSTYLGGIRTDTGYGIALDGNANVYVAGHTASENFPTTAGAYDTSHANSVYGWDAFITKFNAAGTALIYSTYLGGVKDEKETKIVIDGSGNAYVAGYTNSTDFPTTMGALDTSQNGFIDGFIAKLDPSGASLVYSTYLGGTYDDLPYGIALVGSGILMIAGTTQATNFPTTAGAYDTTHNGGRDAFIAKLNSSGTALFYSTYLGGASDDYGLAIAVDGGGSAYVTGGTYSSGFPTTAGAFDATYNGGPDVFVTKINTAGSALVYSTFLGGTSASGEEKGVGIALDGSSNIYVTGATTSTDFPTTAGAYDTVYNGGSYDAFMAKFNPTGTALVYSTYLGGTGNDLGWGIRVDAEGNAYTAGYHNSGGSFPVTRGGFPSAALDDAFLAKLNAMGSDLVFSSCLGGNNADYGIALALDRSGNVFITGQSASSNFPVTPGAYDPTWAGNASQDVFATKFHISDSVVCDFGSVGLWKYNCGSWEQASGANAEVMIAANTDIVPDIEYLIDFGTVGLWQWRRGGDWLQMSGVNLDNMIAADIDNSGDQEIVGDFGSTGLWLWDSDVWTMLSGVNAEGLVAAEVDGLADKEIIADFGSLGAWMWDSGVWEQWSGVNPQGMAVLGMEVIFDFGSVGIWSYYAGIWNQLSGTNPEQMIAADTDGNSLMELVADLGSLGIWKWDGAGWSQLSAANPEDMIAGDIDGDSNTDDELIADLGGGGVWFWNSGAWSQITSDSPEQMVAVDIDGTLKKELVMDFGSLGMWRWSDGSWGQLSAVDPEGLIAEDIR
jgi:hypothetical protein